jgi:hypothetical protein
MIAWSEGHVGDCVKFALILARISDSSNAVVPEK